MTPIRRYFCERCGATGLEGQRGSFRQEAEASGRGWAGACGSCGGTMLDLSYLEARMYLDERVTADEKRRDTLSLALSAPFAFLGLAVGGLLTYWLLVTLPAINVVIFAIPLVVAGVFATVPAKYIMKFLKPRQQAIELSLEEVEALELLEASRRRDGVRAFADTGA